MIDIRMEHLLLVWPRRQTNPKQERINDSVVDSFIYLFPAAIYTTAYPALIELYQVPIHVQCDDLHMIFGDLTNSTWRVLLD